jgi:two-component system sensor histidine kinase AlgZ
MASIRQNAYSDVLPDFRNLGVMARVIVGVNGLGLIAALLAAPDLLRGADGFMAMAMVLEPLLLLCLAVLASLSPVLGRLAYWPGCAVVIGIVLALTAVMHLAVVRVTGISADLVRMLVLAGLLGAGLLGYFRLLAKAFSPALAEARLQALQARIRPHFLFNSLNAVLGLVRRDPKRAERMLEDLADLFRTLMSEPRKFVRLADEISLLERYAELEQLRLGERLSSRARKPARSWSTSRGAATGCSRGSKIRTSNRSSSARATAWRWTISGSAWRCSSTPRRAWRRRPPPAATLWRSKFRIAPHPLPIRHD